MRFRLPAGNTMEECWVLCSVWPFSFQSFLRFLSSKCVDDGCPKTQPEGKMFEQSNEARLKPEKRSILLDQSKLTGEPHAAVCSSGAGRTDLEDNLQIWARCYTYLATKKEEVSPKQRPQTISQHEEPMQLWKWEEGSTALTQPQPVYSVNITTLWNNAHDVSHTATKNLKSFKTEQAQNSYKIK